MNTLTKNATSSVVATCTSITQTATGYAAECTFSTATGLVVIDDSHAPAPTHVLVVKERAPMEFTFSIDQTALPAGYASVTVAGITVPPGSPLKVLSKNTLFDPNPAPSLAVFPFSLVLQATPTGGNAVISATWDPGVENDGPPY